MGREYNMADLKVGFAKSVQKHAVRAKEKILQNLGKADKTTDEVFDEYESNFNKQQLHANKLHKEVSNYLRCARALHGASKALFETLSEVYEPEWVGHDLIYVQSQNSDMIWTDFCHKLQDQSLAPLTAYTQDFPEIKKKIDKRGRKLVDYDSQRHQLESLQRSTRRDEYKIARVKDQLDQAKATYESLNKELYEELPAIYDQRIPNSSNSLQTLFAAESTFMQEASKIAQEVEAIAEKLGRESTKGTYNTRREIPPKQFPSPTSSSSPTVWYAGGDPCDPPAEPESESVDLHVVTPPSPQEEKKQPKPPIQPPQPQLQQHEEEEEEEEANGYPRLSELRLDSLESPPPEKPQTAVKEETGRPYEEIEFEDKKVNGAAPKSNGDVANAIPPGATTTDLPPGVLYRVKATYKYNREDVDELAFDVGDSIRVVEYDDPEEQEEGWLCGILESSNEKGLFPANFTRPI